MRLLLIRHGQTPHNITGALDTARPGAGLTPLGQAQAQAIPAAPAGEDVAAIYASPLVRTRLTAAPLAAARGLDVQVCEGLEEISAGDLELRTDDEAVAAYLSTATGWAEGELRLEHGGVARGAGGRRPSGRRARSGGGCRHSDVNPTSCQRTVSNWLGP